MQCFEAIQVIIHCIFIRSYLVFANIPTDDDIGFSFFQSLHSFQHPAVIKAHSVDKCFILRKPKQSRLRISFLRLWGQCSNLNKTKTQHGHFINQLGIFIKSGCQSHGIFEFQSKYLPFQQRIIQSEISFQCRLYYG